MKPTAENLNARKVFLTDELFRSLSASNETKTDYFTATEKFPKAFRIGSCESASPDNAVLQIVLLWHEDDKNIQREVRAEMVRQNDNWLLNRVLSQ